MLDRLLAEGTRRRAPAWAAGDRPSRPGGRRRRRQDRPGAARLERGAAVAVPAGVARPITLGSTAPSGARASAGPAVAEAGLAPLARPFAATAQFLLAGMDLPEELSALRAAMERMHWSERLVIGNDTEALLRAGTDRGWGIAVVCGTGINCLGPPPTGARRDSSRLALCPAIGAAAATSVWPRWVPPCGPLTDVGRDRCWRRPCRLTSG